MVPTINIILKWIRGDNGAHHYDENLTEVSLITKDAFEPNLPLSVVIHIDYQKAPLVIQRFGDVRMLVEQTLDPMVSAYFKNVGQMRTLIQLIQERSDIQRISSQEMKEKFAHYNLELEEVLIGTPAASEGDKQIEVILNQLRSRQIAVEQIETYARQESAAAKERELREAQARALQQTAITESEISITVQSNQGKAEYQRAVQQANQIRTLAQANAEQIARIGIAQGIAIDEQVSAYGGPQYQVTQQVMTRFAEAVQAARVDVVPRVVVNGGGGGGADGHGGMASGNLMEGLLTLLLSDKLGVDVKDVRMRESNPEADRLREEIRKSMSEKRVDDLTQAAPFVPTMPAAPAAPAPSTPAAPSAPAAKPSFYNPPTPPMTPPAKPTKPTK
jgi:uncharacterized membrane protein YqiK